MTSIDDEVLAAVVESIPRGRWATYGDVSTHAAAAIGRLGR